MPRQGKNSEKDIMSLGEVFIGVAGYSSRGTIVVSSRVYNFTEEKYGGNAASKLWIETVRSENKLALFLDDKNVDPSKFAQLRDGFNQFILTSHISQFVRTCTCIQAFSDAIAFIDRHSPVSRIAKLTPNDVAHIPIFNQDGSNNKVLEATRGAREGVEMEPGADDTRTKKPISF